MPPLFWVDIVGLCISILVTYSLTFSVIGVDPKNPINLSFGLFTGTIAIWSTSALFLRLTLWLEPVLSTTPFLLDTSLWVRFATMFISLTGILSLLFTVTFLSRRTPWSDMALIFAIILLFTFFVFSLSAKGLFIRSVQFDEYGLIRHEKSKMAWLMLGMWCSYIVWSLILFWQERHRNGSVYLALGMLVLMLGIILRGAIFAPFPFLSFSQSACALILAYGVISKQIFNPLKARTIELNKEIEERKEVEKAILVAQQRYHSLFDSKTNLVFIMDDSGCFIDANDLALDLFGYEKENIPDVNYLQLLHPDQTLEPITKAFKEILEIGAQIEPLEVKMRSKTGETQVLC